MTKLQITVTVEPINDNGKVGKPIRKNTNIIEAGTSQDLLDTFYTEDKDNNMYENTLVGNLRVRKLL